MPECDESLSAVGVDYTLQHSLLASGQWQKANEESGAVIFKIIRRVTIGWRKG